MSKASPSDDATLDLLRAEIAEDESRLVKKRAIVAAAELLAAEGFDVAPRANRAVRNNQTETPSMWRKPTWGSVVPDVLSRADRGMSPDDVLQTVRAMPVFQMLTGLKGLYNNLHQMEKAGLLIKAKGLYYTPTLFEKLKASGQPLPRYVRVRRAPLRNYVVSILVNHLPGLTAEQITEELRRMPESPSNVKAHGTYINRILGPMVAKGELVQEGDKYRLPRKGPKMVKGQALSTPDPSVQRVRRGRPTTAAKPVEKGDLH